MYLWKMVVRNQELSFKFTEHTEEKERECSCNSLIVNPSFETDQSYSKDDPAIKPIVDATFKLAKALDIDLTNPMVYTNYIFIERGFSRLIFVYRCGGFEAKLEKEKIVLRTDNEWTFTKEQFNAMFEFLELLKETNWFF